MSIANRIDKLEEEKQNLQKKLLEDIREINKKIREIRKDCDHQDYTFYGDPSGNNDSFRQCNVCGVEW